MTVHTPPGTRGAVHEPGETTAERSFGKRVTTGLIWWGATWPIIAVSIYPLFYVLASLAGALPRSTDLHFLGPGTVYWLLPAVLLAGPVAALLSRFIVRRTLGAPPNGFPAFLVARFGIDPFETVRPVLAAVVTGVLVMLVFGLHGNVRFTEDAMVSTSYGGLQTVHNSYSELSEIWAVNAVRDDQGRVAVCPHYEIHFRTGTRWSTLNAGLGGREVETSLVAAISRRSGRPIRVIETVPR